MLSKAFEKGTTPSKGPDPHRDLKRGRILKSLMSRRIKQIYMPNYSVNIALDSATLTALSNGNYQMQVFKGAQSPAASAGQPVVWFALSQFSSTVNISWTDSYGGFFSNTIPEPGAVVTIATSSPMNLGDIFTLQATGQGALTSGGPATAYSFESLEQTEWSCGLTTAACGGQPTAICAFPQYSTIDNLIEPYEMVLVVFTQTPVNTGSVVQTAVSTSVSIVLAPSEPNCSVSFDINKGWDIGDQANVAVNPPNFELAPALIIPPASDMAQGKINLHKAIK